MILFSIGLVKLLDSAAKSIIRRHSRLNDDILSKELRFRLLNFNFILHLYANPEDADINENNIISPGEAALLAASLSLDGMAVGFGAALGNINIGAAFFASFFTNMFAVCLGCFLGNRLSGRLPFNVSWLSGIIFVGLAISKLI